jgi:hypothetical protein
MMYPSVNPATLTGLLELAGTKVKLTSTTRKSATVVTLYTLTLDNQTQSYTHTIFIRHDSHTQGWVVDDNDRCPLPDQDLVGLLQYQLQKG